MKKVILMATFALISMVSFAQQSIGTLLVRPKIGLNFADLTNMNTTPRVGVVLGAEAEYQLTDIVSASVGALYSVQGAKLNGFKLPTINATMNEKVTQTSIISHSLFLQMCMLWIILL